MKRDLAAIHSPRAIYNDAHRCRHCGYRYDAHGGAQNPHGAERCPAVEKFPKWPKSIKDELRAGQLFERRIVKHWTARSTTFAPA